MKSNTFSTQPRPALIRMSPRRLIWLGVAAAVVWSAIQANLFGHLLINSGGWPLVLRMLEGLFHPKITPAFLALTLDSMLITLAYAVIGTVFSLVIGLVGGVLSSEVWWQAHGLSHASGKVHSDLRRISGQGPWMMARALLAVPRSLHEIVWGLIFVNILGLVPLTAILAIALPFGAICAKVFSEILDEQPRQAFLALRNAGAPPLQAFCYGLFPLALPDLISYAFYRFECSIRSATVLGIIGAGGLGYQILLSLQSLRYEELLPLLVALLILSGITDLWSSQFRRSLGGSNRIDIQNRSMSSPLPTSTWPKRSSATVRWSMMAFLVLTVSSFMYLQPDFASLAAPRTTQLLSGMIQDAFPPQLPAGGFPYLLHLSGQTLAISILAMSAAGTFAIGAAFLSSNRLWQYGRVNHQTKEPRTILAWLIRFLLLISRAVPTPIWALIVLFVFFPGILPGAIALAVHNWGITGRLMAETVENMDEKPLLALQSLGASQGQTLLYGALPGALPGFISYIFYRWENCLRETVVVGIVGAGGLGRLLNEQLSNFDYSGITVTLMALIGLTILVDLLSAVVRRTIR